MKGFERKSMRSLVAAAAVAALTGLLYLESVAAGPKTGGSFTVEDDLTTGSAGSVGLSGGSYEVTGSLGQTGSAVLSGGSFLLDGGYFNFPASAGPGIKIWAGGSGLANVGANWIGGVAPVTGDYVIFGDTAPNISCSWNLPITLASVTVAGSYNAQIFFDNQIVVSGPFELLSGATANFTTNGGNKHRFLGPITVQAGTFHVGGTTVVAVGSMTVTTGKFEIHDKGRLEALQVGVNGSGVLKVYDDTVLGAPLLTSTATNVAWQLRLDGRVEISTGVFEHLDANGMRIGAGAQLASVSSFTFRELAPGATAINFYDAGGPIVSTFSGVRFDSGEIAVSVRGDLLASGSRITMRAASGVKAGASFENDPSGRVDWVSPVNAGAVVAAAGTGVFDSTERQGQRKLARDTAGNLYLAYLKLFGGKKRLFLSRSTDNGATWADTTATPIETVGDESPGFDQGAPSLAIDQNNALHLVWAAVNDTLDAVGGNEAKIAYSSASTPGSTWSAAVKIPGNSYEGIEDGPVIAVDSQNGIHVAWYGQNSGSEHGRVRYSSRAASAGTFNPYADVSYDSADSRLPSIAIDSNDAVHLVAQRRSGSGSGVYERIVHSSRTANGAFNPWQTVSLVSGYEQEGPSLAIEGNNRLHAVWSGPDASYANHQVKHSSRAAYGGAWSSYLNIAPIAAAPQRDASIATGGGVDLYAVWHGSDAANPIRNVKTSGFLGDQLVWEAWSNLSNGAADQTHPSIRWAGWRNNGGQITVAWTSDAGGSSLEVRATAPPESPAFPGFGAGGPGGIPAVTNLSASPGNDVGSVRLNWNWPDALVTGASFYIEYSTNPSHAFSTTTVQLVKSTGPTIGGGQASWSIGGLDAGLDATNADASPNYNFRLWISTAPGAFSNASNPASSKPQIPPPFIHAFTDFGGAGTPGGGWLATANLSGAPEEKAMAVARDGSANLYVTGRFFNGTSTDVYVRKYNSGGAPQWTRYYNSPANNHDEGRGIAVAGGNVYVAGFSNRPDLGQGRNQLGLKFDSAGNRQWVQEGDNAGLDDEMSAAAVDGSGSVYFAGFQGESSSARDLIITKMDTNGLFLWTTYYNGASNGDDEALGIARDVSGNLYVAGREFVSGQGSNILVRKYDSSNPPLLTWTTTYNGLAGTLNDGAEAIAVDGSGTVYVAGYETVGGQGENAWVRKYSNATPPQEFWTSTYNGGGSGNDKGKAIAQTGDGVFVAGFATEGSLDIFVRKHAQSNGLPVWTTGYAGTGGAADEGQGIAADNASGEVFVAGFENKAGESSNVWLRKFNSDAFGSGVAAVTNLAAVPAPAAGAASLSWSYPDNLAAGASFYIEFSTEPGHAFNFAKAQVVVATGPLNSGAVQNIDVFGLDVGRTGGDGEMSPFYGFRVWIASSGVFSVGSNIAVSSGAMQFPFTNGLTNLGASGPGSGWLATFDDSFQQNDRARGVAKDGAGNVYIAGDLGNGANQDQFLRKHDPSGAVQWTKVYNGRGAGNDFAHGVAVGPSGEVYLAGSEFRGDAGQNLNLTLRRYGSDGLLHWSTSYSGPNNGDDEALAVAADGSGVFVGGYHTDIIDKGGINILVSKYGFDGLLQWTTEYTSAGTNVDQAQGIAVSGNDLYLTGYETAANENLWLRKYSASNGLASWTTTYNSPGNNAERGQAVAADGAGAFVAGFERRTDLSQGDNVLVRKFSPTDGSAIWTSTFNGVNSTNDIALGAAVEAGQVYIAGRENTAAQDDNIWVRKYSAADGLIQWTTAYNGPSNLADSALAVAVDTAGAVFVAGRELVSGQGDNALLRKYNFDAFGGGSGGGVQAFVQSSGFAPPQLPVSVTDRRMLALRLWTAGGSVNLNSVALSLFGDAPATQINAALFKDNNQDGNKDGGDTFLGSMAFVAGAPPKATINPSPGQVLDGTTRHYLVVVTYTGVPAGKRLEIALDQPSDLSLSAGFTDGAGFPNHRSGQSTVVFELYAKPSSQIPAYSTPTAPNINGLDTFFYANSGQQVAVEAAGSWNDGSGFFTAAGNVGGGNCGSCVVSSTASARLIGRVGSGNWFALGPSSTFTVSGSGNLFLAMNDDDYSNNSGSITVTYRALASNTAKVWVGGTAGALTNASVDSNWLGGQKPFNGERVEFSSNTAYDCDWNLNNLTLSSLEMTTHYARVLKLVNTTAGTQNSLTVSTHVLLAGGTLSLGNAHILEVQGTLTLKSSATLDMGVGESARNGVLRTKGLTLKGGAFLRSVIPASMFHAEFAGVAGAGLWPFRIEDSTVTVKDHGPAVVNSSVIDILASAKINAFDGVSVEGTINNAAPSVVFHAASSINRTFNDWEFLAPHVSTNASASDVAAGSNITFNNATGGRMGTPYESDLGGGGVIFWSPDGGGTGSIAGTLSYTGAPGPLMQVRFSTEPRGGVNAVGFTNGFTINQSSGSVGYTAGSLQAPNTWYIFGFRGGANPSGQDARGGVDYPGSFRSSPLFLSAGAALTGKNVTMQDWGTVSGAVAVNTSQVGTLRVLACHGNLPCSNLESDTTAPSGGGSYSFDAAPGSDYSILAFMDVDNDKVFDDFEAYGSSSVVAVSGLSTTSGVNITVTGGSAASGGAVFLTTFTAHPGAIAANGSQALLGLKLFSASQASTLNGVKLEYTGNLPSGAAGLAGFYLKLFEDTNGNDSFDDGPAVFDAFKTSLFLSGGVSSGTLAFPSADSIPAGSTRTYFAAVDLGGYKVATAGLRISTSADFALSAGAMATQSLYPVQTSASVGVRVPGNAFAYPDGTGGHFTGFFVYGGQQIAVSAVGSWVTTSGGSSVGPGGSGATGLNTVLPSAKVGELIGRVAPFGGASSSTWIRVGASTSGVTVPRSGELVLAMNDLVGAYGDNSGGVLADFSVSGSTLGALQGTVSYDGGTAGMLDLAAVRASDGFVAASTSIQVGVPTSYNYLIGSVPPGFYTVRAQHQGAAQHKGGSFAGVEVPVGAATTLNVEVFTGANNITGNIVYAGVQNFGNFIIAAATHTDFERHPVFFGTAAVTSPGAYSLTNLLAPNTYYLVSCRDANFDFDCDGPEAFGNFGSSTGSISRLPFFLAPVSITPGAGASGINITVNDKGAVNASVGLPSGSAGKGVILEAGIGPRGAPGYFPENRRREQIPNPPPAGGLFVELGLLRPATNYSVFAFLDDDNDESHDAGEFFFEFQAAVRVDSGSAANLNFALSGVQLPAQPAAFSGTGGNLKVDFSWNAVSGATLYKLQKADGSPVASVVPPTTTYTDTLAAATSSQIRRVVANNSAGDGPAASLETVYSQAAAPSGLAVGGVTETGANLSWTANNPSGTVFEVHRATGDPAPGPFGAVGTTALSTFSEGGLAAGTTYFWKVRAVNGNALASSFDGPVSTKTAPASSPSLSGTLSYAGKQPGPFVIQASTMASFAPISASHSVPNLAAQSYFRPVGSGQSYYLRAFVDGDGDGALDAGEDRGAYGAPTAVGPVGGPTPGIDFSIGVDTVAPNPPAGVIVAVAFNLNTVTWNPPLKNADGSSLNDLRGFLVERSTGTGFALLTPAPLSSTTVSFADDKLLAGLSHSYRVRAADFGLNISSPSAPVSVTPNTGGTISGFLSTYTATTAGIFRVRLSTDPAPNRGVIAQQDLGSQGSFNFTGLSTGTYFVRAFRDLNGDSIQVNLNEPSGTFGGLNRPFPVYIAGGNAVGGANVDLCDRTQIPPSSAPVVNILANGCPAKDKGAGHATSLLSFPVGGGTANSLGIGSEVDISVSPIGGTGDSELIVLDPFGNVVARDNRPGGAYAVLRLNTTGIYLIEPTSFAPGVYGAATVSFNVRGGFAGSIFGSVSYGGGQGGQIKLQLFNSPDPSAFPVQVINPPGTGPYSFPGLSDGTYYVRGFRDSNANLVRDPGEASGSFGPGTAPTPITIIGGVSSLGGAPADFTLSDPAFGAVSGAVFYSGSQSGSIRVEAGTKKCPTCEDLNVAAFSGTSTISGQANSFLLNTLPSATNYMVRVFVDGNGNLQPDIAEARASSFPVNVVAGSTSTLSFFLEDPGSGASGNGSIVGSIGYTGPATGTILVGFSRDSSFSYLDYVLTLAAPGSYSKSGVLDNTTYYMAAFRDSNNNGNPDERAGEPSGVGAPESFTSTPTFANAPAIFVPLSGAVTAHLTLADPPNGQITGQVSYSSVSFAGAPLRVEAYLPGVFSGDNNYAFQTIGRLAGTTHYAYSLPFLAAATFYQVQGFVDLNSNNSPDFGEPFSQFPTAVAVSSGVGGSPAAGKNFVIFDAGSFGGGGGGQGRVEGFVQYSGGQSGNLMVRFFDNANFIGVPVATAVIPGSAGPGTFGFVKDQLPLRTFYADAFKDVTGTGSFDPAFQAQGRLNGGGPISLTQAQPFADIGTGVVLDPGSGAGGSQSISGSLRYNGAQTCSVGGCRIRSVLFPVGTDQPVTFSDAAFGASTAYNFTGLTSATPTYRSQHFADLNNDFRPDPTEPVIVSSASGIPLGGLSSVSDQNYILCDRQLITAGTEVSSSLNFSDCTAPDRGGAFQKLFAFQGRRGQPVTISNDGVTLPDTYLTLYDPLGKLIFTDDESGGNRNARITAFSLPLDGLYTIGASAYDAGMTGSFKLNFSGSSGNPGSIAGEVSYTGTQGGQFVVGVFKSTDFTPATFVADQVLIGTRSFNFGGLISDTSYYLGSFIDVNFNHFPDPGEDGGVFGNGVASPIYLQGGQNLTGVDIIIAASTDTAANFGFLTGVISYPGAQGVGKFLRVELWPSANFTGAPAAVKEFPVDAAPGAYPYDMGVPGGAAYYARAFLDLNSNFIPDLDEPKGVYAPNSQGAESVFVPAAGAAEADFSIKDPFVTDSGQVAGEGTAVLSAASVAAGAQSALRLTYTVGANGMAAGARVGLAVPPGFGFPFSVSAATVAPSISGPGVGLTLNAGLAAGALINLDFSVYAPCLQGVSTFTVVSSSGAGIAPTPLVAGSPLVKVTTGTASFFQPRNPYFTVRQGTLSEEQALEAYDSCGNRTAVTGSAKTVALRAKKYDFLTGQFAADAEVGLSSNPALSTGAALSLDFAVGRSSRSFFVLSASTGAKSVEVFFNLGAPTTFYYGFTALPSNALSAVSVATAPFGVAGSSVTIFPGDPAKANLAFFNFTLGDNNIGWRVVVSSVSLDKGGQALWERYGFGAPAPGSVSWDGRFSPWINNGARVPTGVYSIRIEAGSGLKNETLRVKVDSPQLRGTVWDRSTTPPSRLSDAALDAFGPFGGARTVSDAQGAYVLPGLAAGTYNIYATRQDYVPGQVSVGLQTGGVISTWSALGDAVLVSTEAAASGETLLNLYMKSPGSLLVTANGVGIATAAFDRWGGLQVRKSTSCASTAQAEALYGPLRLRAGTTVFDDGGQWDPASGQFVERSFHKFLVSPSTYAAEAFLEGFLPSCTTGYVSEQGGRIDLPAFTQRGSISGTVSVPSNAQGLFVSVSAVAFSTLTSAQPGFGGIFLGPGVLTGTYTVNNLEAGTFVLRANAQGFTSISSGPVVLAASEQKTGFNFDPFGVGAAINGTATIQADTTGRNLQLFVSAWAPGTLNFGSTEVFKAGGAAGLTINYNINGLSAGATYQIYAHLAGVDDVNLEILEGLPLSRPAPGTQNFSFVASSGVIIGSITLSSNDFLNVDLFGEVVAAAKPQRVGETFQILSSTNLPGFRCTADNAAAPTGFCPVGNTSATFQVTGLDTETLDITLHYKTSGASKKARVSVVNGSTTTVAVDLTPQTYSITGLIDNQISNALFKSSASGAAANILANAAYVDLLDKLGDKIPLSPAGVPVSTASLARVLAIRQELDQYNLAVSTSFNPATDRAGFLTAAGSYTISGLPPGNYFVRTANLRTCATCETLVPAAGQIVRLSNVSRSSVNFTLTDGFSVSGSVILDGGILDSRVLGITVFNRRQEVVRSTTVYLGDAALGVTANSVAYEFKNLPAGDFYTIAVRDETVPAKYAGRPIKVPDATSAGGLQKDLAGQDVTLQRAAFIVGRLKDQNTGELIGKANATLLASNFRIAAVANPFVDGGFVLARSSVAGRPIEADDYFRVGPLIPKLNYDLKLEQTSWDASFLTQGSQNYAPVVVGGLLPQEGEVKDVGFVGLNQGSSLSGTIHQSTTTGALLGNIKVTGKPSFGDSTLTVQTYTNAQGRYTLWVSTAVSNQFDVTAAPRDGNLASNGSYYGEKTLRNVSLLATTTADFLLEPLVASVTGQVAVEDAATGGELSYPFGDKKGFPAAAINLQPVGIVPIKNPLGDIEGITDASGLFEIPGLSTGTYGLRVTSLGYAVFKATVSVTTGTVVISTLPAGTPLPGNLITLSHGGSVSGKIVKRDGSAPSEEEVAGVAAANFAQNEFVVGSVEVDPTARTVSAYNLSGFKPGVAYDIVLLPKEKGGRPILPPEGAAFSVTSATTSLTDYTLSYPSEKPDCTADAKALGNSQFQVKIECTGALRKTTDADDDAAQIVYVSSRTGPDASSPLSANTGHTAPNSTGQLLGPGGETYPSGREIAGSRKKITVIYRATSTAETAFSVHFTAYFADKDQTTGENFLVDKIFDFFTGLDSDVDEDVSNITGGEAELEPSTDDENNSKEERSKLAMSPGTFAQNNGVVCASCTVTLGISKHTDQSLAKTLSVLNRGVLPQGVSIGARPRSLPGEMEAALGAYRTLQTTMTVGSAQALSSFYSIFLPATIRHQLSQPADLTLSYAAAAATDTANVNVWFYNATTGKYQKEETNRRIDTDNKTITVKIDHLSTFVVLEGAPVENVARTFGGSGIQVAPFPNPADCITHSNIARNNLLGAPGQFSGFVGPMIRYSLPDSGRGDYRGTKIVIYNVAGERVRVIDQGSLEGGKTYYMPWDCRNETGRVITSGVYIGEVVWGKDRKLFKIAIIKGSGL